MFFTVFLNHQAVSQQVVPSGVSGTFRSHLATCTFRIGKNSKGRFGRWYHWSNRVTNLVPCSGIEACSGGPIQARGQTNSMHFCQILFSLLMTPFWFYLKNLRISVWSKTFNSSRNGAPLSLCEKNPHPFEELMFLFPFSTQKKKHQHFETHIRSQVVFLNEAWQVFLMVLETHFWAQPMAPGRRWQKEEGVEKRWRWRTETWSTERESL